MKYLISISILLAWLIGSLCADETQRYGFLNVVNMIPSATPCEIDIAGKKLVPDGLKQAAETGWFMVPIGSSSISIVHPEYRKHRSNITIAEGGSNLIVIYLQASGKMKEDGELESSQIRFATVGAYQSTGFALKAVSMLPETSRFQLARETVELDFLKVTEIPKWNGGGFQIRYDAKNIGEVARGRDRASYMLLLSADHKGGYLTAIVNADPQKLPPWMQK